MQRRSPKEQDTYTTIMDSSNSQAPDSVEAIGKALQQTLPVHPALADGMKSPTVSPFHEGLQASDVQGISRSSDIREPLLVHKQSSHQSTNNNTKSVTPSPLSISFKDSSLIRESLKDRLSSPLDCCCGSGTIRKELQGLQP